VGLVRKNDLPEQNYSAREIGVFYAFYVKLPMLSWSINDFESFWVILGKITLIYPFSFLRSSFVSMQSFTLKREVGF
jgi:hypothetical protein